MTIFSVQNATGSVVQVEIQDHPGGTIAAGDTGTYGPDELAFYVTDVRDQKTFSISTTQGGTPDITWPETGTITWSTGANASTTSTVTEIDRANAYISVAQFTKYHETRGTSFAASPVDAIEQAIVKATDYVDQKYSYKGIKAAQSIGNAVVDPTLAFADPFIFPAYGVGVVPFFAPSTTGQETEWPRQGVVDNNGDTILGVPRAIMQACAELALRSLNGITLQPDYDDTVVKNGGILQSYSEEVGPIRVSYTYDTERGLGFFASFPQVDRMLSKSGLLASGGGRRVIR